ncbi:hypothetical protein [Rhodococcus sp. 1168]|uniref:hypothetical protein n=1 Tax=Rhodococcus sp. 1168 TaxID=2018041 RepID=UPI000A0A56D8|nr:hypothetical protein [Rhodococcus sp. 1168]ORI13436.1 hypothetical protein BJI47_22595 [Rhodococcus sp. 1168]
MAKIREDFEGVIYVRSGADVVKLAAGDDVPQGVDVAPEHTGGGPVKVESAPVSGDSAPKKRATRSTKAAADDSGDEG